jgi:hypothetical protein
MTTRTIPMPNATQQPPVTDANISNEIEYWLSQVPPHKVLEILGHKLHTSAWRDKPRQSEREALAKVVSGLADLAFKEWSR